ncbi:hypothetical protein [Rhodococcus rhodochrous]|nr:hypothetical protein [Rhodococcus rhodochrous]MBF4480167.1 hypothetical protein [Rhodococcus rhodochrous]
MPVQSCHDWCVAVALVLSTWIFFMSVSSIPDVDPVFAHATELRTFVV